MSRTHTADGRRISSMTHASRRHTCSLPSCEWSGFGNGAETSHGRAHVRRGEALELVKVHGYPAGTSRLFLPPGDERIPHLEARGFEVQS